MSRGVVFITGGSRGIGRATVLKFAKEGFTVFFSYNSRRDKAEEVAGEAGGEVYYVRMDVADLDSVHGAYEFVSGKVRYLNVLVNNAGIASLTSFRELTYEEWEKVIKVDLTGVFLVTKTFLPLLMNAPWASIVNVASITGQTGHVLSSAAYCAAKAGVIGFTRRLAVELAPNIRVNAVAPSIVETDMTRSLLDTEEKRRRAAALHPLARVARPEEIAEAIYFLALGDKTGFITGQVLNVNGGRLIC